MNWLSSKSGAFEMGEMGEAGFKSPGVFLGSRARRANSVEATGKPPTFSANIVPFSPVPRSCFGIPSLVVLLLSPEIKI